MHIIIPAFVLALVGPGGSMLTHVTTASAEAVARLVTMLPDPAAAAVMSGGLGLIAGARRRRSHEVAD